MGIDVIMPLEFMSLLAWMTLCLMLAIMFLAITGLIFLFSSYFILSSGILNSKLSQMCVSKGKHFPRQTRRSSHVWLQKLVSLEQNFSSVSKRTFQIENALCSLISFVFQPFTFTRSHKVMYQQYESLQYKLIW